MSLTSSDEPVTDDLFIIVNKIEDRNFISIFLIV